MDGIGRAFSFSGLFRASRKWLVYRLFSLFGSKGKNPRVAEHSSKVGGRKVSSSKFVFFLLLLPQVAPL
jgi:hypothetical protein